jgi:hypothetical protein
MKKSVVNSGLSWAKATQKKLKLQGKNLPHAFSFSIKSIMIRSTTDRISLSFLLIILFDAALFISVVDNTNFNYDIAAGNGGDTNLINLDEDKSNILSKSRNLTVGHNDTVRLPCLVQQTSNTIVIS